MNMRSICHFHQCLGVQNEQLLLAGRGNRWSFQGGPSVLEKGRHHSRGVWGSEPPPGVSWAHPQDNNQHCSGQSILSLEASLPARVKRLEPNAFILIHQQGWRSPWPPSSFFHWHLIQTYTKKGLLVKVRAAFPAPRGSPWCDLQGVAISLCHWPAGFCHTCTHLPPPSTVLITSILVELPLSYKSKHNSLFPVKLKKINV